MSYSNITIIESLDITLDDLKNFCKLILINSWI